jgi:hypothetical protein
MTRRTSAEVVNATLLEVFLAFVFVVLSVAWFEHTASVQAANTVDSLATVQKGLVKQRELLRQALILSPYAPPCRREVQPKYFATVTLTQSGTVDVRVNRTELGHPAGQRFAVTPEALADSFWDILQFSTDSTCHFLAVVRDATVSKESYKRGLKAVRDIFYTVGELR